MSSDSQYDVLGIGNALLDYQIEVPFEFLTKHSLTKGSMTLVDEKTQTKLLEQVVRSFGLNAVKRTSGGCSANTLAGIASYGGSTYFVGKVAADEQGDAYSSDLIHAGVGPGIIKSAHGRTGTCIALITPDAERTMLTHLGIATELAPQEIDEKKIEAAKMIYIEGYLWDPPSGRESSKRAIEIAKAKGKKVAFTYSDSFCVERHHSDFVSLAKNSIDILFCNESEALKATKTSKVEDAFQILKDWSDTVCITIGPRGALLSSKSANTVEQLPTWHVKLVDKLGAGDLFAAGVLYGLTTGKTLREAGFLGCYSATRVIQQMSARLEVKLSRFVNEALRGPTAEEGRLAASGR